MKITAKNFKKSYYDHVRPNAIVIIPTKNDTEPVLIFKHLGAPFYAESPFGHKTKIAHNDFFVYWKRKFLHHTLPACFDSKQRGFFDMLIRNRFHTHHWWEDFPGGCIELPLAILTNAEFQLSGAPLLKNVRNTLRKLGLLSERRGKIKSPSNFKKSRDKEIISAYIKLGQSRRLPIKKIANILRLKGQTFFPNEPHKAAKYDLSDRQIRNTIHQYRASLPNTQNSEI